MADWTYYDPRNPNAATEFSQGFDPSQFTTLLPHLGLTMNGVLSGVGGIDALQGRKDDLQRRFYDAMAQKGYKLGRTTNGSKGSYQLFDQQGNGVGDAESFDSGGMAFMLSPILAAAGVAGLQSMGLLGGAAGEAAGAAGGLADMGGLSAAQAAEISSMAANPLTTVALNPALAMDLPTLASMGAGSAGLGGLGGGIGTLGEGLPEISKIAYDPISKLPAADVSLPAGIGDLPSFTPNIKTFGDAPSIGQTPAPIDKLPGIGSAAADLSTIGAGSGLLGSVGSFLKDNGSWLAPTLGAVAGAVDAGKPNTASSTSKIDPRMEQYLYGSGMGDQNSVLGAIWNQFKSNPSGINPTMQQGLDMGKAALTDPAYAQGYQQMRSIGQGLMGGGVAANPFSNGQGGQVPQMGLLTDPTRAQSLIARGRGLLGQI